MILGEYDASAHEVVVAITISDGNHSETIPAVVDTGFTGFLMLPVSLAGGFRFPPLDNCTVELGDGRQSTLDTCEVVTQWHKQERSVRAFLAPRPQALIGMKLLREKVVGGYGVITSRRAWGARRPRSSAGVPE